MLNRTALLACSLVLAGCSPMKAAGNAVDSLQKIVTGEETSEVSLTLSDVPETQKLFETLKDLDVEAVVENVEQGVMIVKLIGTYTELMSAINSLLVKGFVAIVANNGFSQKVLDAAKKAAD
jgi:hypothetical protein